MEEIHALQPVLILLLVGILAVTLMRPLRISPIVGYLLAGILIGPDGFGLIKESNTTHLLAELGVVFLLFDIGLHFSLGHIWNARREILGLGPIQVIFCTALHQFIGVRNAINEYGSLQKLIISICPYYLCRVPSSNLSSAGSSRHPGYRGDGVDSKCDLDRSIG